MKNKLLIIYTSIIVAVVLVLMSSFGQKADEPFYYAFNEKIYLETVPGKLVVRYATEDKAKAVVTNAQAKGGLKTVEWKDKRTAVIDADATAFRATVDAQGDAISIQPLYRTSKEKINSAITNEIVVKFKPSVSKTEMMRILAAYKLTIIDNGELFTTLSVPAKADALAIANKIQESGIAEFSHPNFYMDVQLHQVPNDEFFGFQWNLNNTGQVINDGHIGTVDADIDAPEAWCKTMGSSGIVVAVIDEGVTSNHPDLPNTRQVRLNGSNFSDLTIPNDPSPVGDGNHGNACSGIIAATRNNNQGIAGVAPNCKIMPIKILNPAATSANLANAITFAKNNGAHVLSNSWGFNSTNPNLVPAIVTAINDAVTTGRGGLGCVVVFSTGNTADHAGGNAGTVNFPGNVNIPGVLTVGASDRFDHQANYSPTSNPASALNQIVDIVAPSHRAYSCQIAGETFEIWSNDIPGSHGYNSWHESGVCLNPPAVGAFLPTAGTYYLSYTGRMGGTSAACPQVAGAAALVLSLNASLTQMQVFNILTQSTDKVGGVAYNASGFSNEMGFGRLNLNKAVTVAGADLYMKDQSTDAGFEPNPDNVSAYYVSPDIWVRNANDGGTINEAPEYGITNYIYVRVRNRGTLASAIGNNLKLYWAKASTGLSWPFPWTGAAYTCGSNSLPIGGLIGAQAIASVAAGSSTILIFPWAPPKPDDYAPCFGDPGHFCLLGRIETPCGMTTTETANLWANVQNNNNIVWKNITVVDIYPNIRFPICYSVLITGSKFLRKKFTTTDLVFTLPQTKGNNNILDVATLDLDLGIFTKAWLGNGGKVEGAKVYEDETGIKLRLTSTKVKIYGVPINPDQIGSVTLCIPEVRDFPFGQTYLFDLQQWDGKTLIGGEQFDFRFAKEGKPVNGATTQNLTMKTGATTKTITQQLKAYQNGSQLVIQINDNKQYLANIVTATGQVMLNQKMTNQLSVPVSAYSKGLYFIKLTNLADRKQQAAKVIIQ